MWIQNNSRSSVNHGFQTADFHENSRPLYNFFVNNCKRKSHEQFTRSHRRGLYIKLSFLLHKESLTAVPIYSFPFFFHSCTVNLDTIKVFYLPNDARERLRWSRGSVLAFGTQVRGFKPGRSRQIFTPSFGGEVKPSVPCRRFTACKRFLNATWKSGISVKIHRPFLAHIVPHLAARISGETTSGESWNV